MAYAIEIAFMVVAPLLLVQPHILEAVVTRADLLPLTSVVAFVVVLLHRVRSPCRQFQPELAILYAGERRDDRRLSVDFFELLQDDLFEEHPVRDADSTMRHVLLESSDPVDVTGNPRIRKSMIAEHAGNDDGVACKHRAVRTIDTLEGKAGVAVGEWNDLELEVLEAMNAAVEDWDSIEHVVVGTLENVEIMILNVVNDSKTSSPHCAVVSAVT